MLTAQHPTKTGAGITLQKDWVEIDEHIATPPSGCSLILASNGDVRLGRSRDKEASQLVRRARHPSTPRPARSISPLEPSRDERAGAGRRHRPSERHPTGSVLLFSCSRPRMQRDKRLPFGTSLQRVTTTTSSPSRFASALNAARSFASTCASRSVSTFSSALTSLKIS